MATKLKKILRKTTALGITLEDTLNALAYWGKPSLAQKDSGRWYCSLSMASGKKLEATESTSAKAVEKCWWDLGDYLRSTEAEADALPRE